MADHDSAKRRPQPSDLVLGLLAVALAASGAVAADAAGAAGAHALTTLEQLLLGAVATEASVIAFLFYRLESSRQKLYEDARADAENDREMAAALKAIAERLPDNPKEDRAR